MPFNSWPEAEQRLQQKDGLTTSEVRDLKAWMHQITEVGMRRLYSELALQNLEAVQNFERSSSRLSLCLLFLTGVLVVLTAVMAYYSYLLLARPG